MKQHAGRILVVDDMAVPRMILARALQQEGYTTEIAVGGREALERLRTEPFDAVLLDVLMPDLDGYEVLAEMKQDERLLDVPVIMVSAVEDIESTVRCIELGAEDYLPKPLNPVLLRARVGASIEKKLRRDREVEYLRQVGELIDAAAAVEAHHFERESIAEVAQRDDELGTLGRVFQRMADEVLAREERLMQQVQQLRVQIDASKQAEQVAAVTETEYFEKLQALARERRRPRPPVDRESPSTGN